MNAVRSLLPLLVTLVACSPEQPRAGAADEAPRAGAPVTPVPSPAEGAVPAAVPTAAHEPDGEADVDAALAVLRGYYAAIAARDYGRAYAAWGEGGPPGLPSPEAFAAGFAGTDSVVLEAGPPGRVEGAAGSRYLTVPVTLRAVEHGRPVTYTGSYDLRRTVVDGTSPAARRWHLYRAAIRREGAGR